MCNLMGQLLKLYYFWIKRICLFLAYNYTVVQMVTTSEEHRLYAIKDNIDYIKKIYVQLNRANYQNSPIMLYTAGQNITDACYKAVLHCYYLEMKTIVEELIVLKAKDTGEQKLLHLEENLNISPTFTQWGDCARCEQFEERTFTVFIKAFEEFIKMLNVKEYNYQDGP
ncbi:interleukin-15 [Xenopus laevis]|uniref:Interleukin n=2 Tax=Xenopus laevis TaxID=8355 RepID=A0A1L8HLT4_XENLA|nr:interleukin-15 [Xenopus laevis]XP_041435500.1 interleukin-15 [Xenopus laevis]OCT97049.1 hypothetical protein XELAEV_18009271mg [Xenopus laevis]